jgi:hypothetical protein
MYLTENPVTASDTVRYAKCIEVSKRMSWDIDQDVIRGRSFDFTQKFLPEGLSYIGKLAFLRPDEQVLLSQIQGRTYANMFGLVERFIGAKMLDLTRNHWFGDQTALQALVRFSDEELKHQALFRRIDELVAVGMPEGYDFVADPDIVAEAVLTASTWAVLALTFHTAMLTQIHYGTSLEPDADLSDLYKDVFLFHWREESQHAILDELEWLREDARITPIQRDESVDDLIELVSAVDGVALVQAEADKHYFLRNCGRILKPAESSQLSQGLVAAYRWQYIVSGVQDPRFMTSLSAKITPAQLQRIQTALAPLMA